MTASRTTALAHSADFTPIAPGCAPGPQLIAGPTELARWIRMIIGAPSTMRLRYGALDGGWSTVRGNRFVGRNVPTIRAAVEGCVVHDGRIFLLDRSDVTDRTSLPDIEAAVSAIRKLMGRLAALPAPAPQRVAVEVLDAPATSRRRLAAAGVR